MYEARELEVLKFNYGHNFFSHYKIIVGNLYLY